jgi:hypothetical protein
MISAIAHLHIGEFNIAQSLISQILLHTTIRIIPVIISVNSAKIPDVFSSNRTDCIVLYNSFLGYFDWFSGGIHKKLINELEIIGIIIDVLIEK